MTSFSVNFLGQAGFRLSSATHTIYIDPYLSDSVRILDVPDLVRQVPVPVEAHEIQDADVVLITHEHIDHCDPHTLPALAAASSQAWFVGPTPVLNRLREWGLPEERLQLAQENWTRLVPGLELCAVPAAHPCIERDSRGCLACVGYVLKGETGELAYFAGDTGVVQELIDTLKGLGQFQTAFLPVNEQNFFRARRGIIGNMSVREAFLFAEEIGAAKIFPCHWDMFAANTAYPEEITLIRDKLQASCVVLSSPCELF
ncbi:hypothetical protein NB231_02783 [Nitrococcus mobilis Nb-231]|uniref:Metallo-beta-lactamase domain-containing protein n=1 Tax=Nitrococcus mobilis Nb-231 TaxID=314278 RepID=A4BRT6_9GAMM|nr:hypothetical protein NB231_02783 [Nitrococcus mobilis Nb-231]